MNEYKVEKLLEKRCSRRRVGNKTRYVDEYLVKWLGYSSEDNSWEPAKNILDKKLIDNLDNGEWEVQRLLGKRVRKLQVEYLVEWADCPREAATWEPEHNVNDALIKQWEESNGSADAEHAAQSDVDTAEHHDARQTQPLPTRVLSPTAMPDEQAAVAAATSASCSSAPVAAPGRALQRPHSSVETRKVHWADGEGAPSTLEQVKYVETEFGLPANASERERRAHLAGLERAKLRLATHGTGRVARKAEGKGHLCTSDDALPRALEVAKEVASMVA